MSRASDGGAVPTASPACTIERDKYIAHLLARRAHARKTVYLYWQARRARARSSEHRKTYGGRGNAPLSSSAASAACTAITSSSSSVPVSVPVSASPPKAPVFHASTNGAVAKNGALSSKALSAEPFLPTRAHAHVWEKRTHTGTHAYFTYYSKPPQPADKRTTNGAVVVVAMWVDEPNQAEGDPPIHTESVELQRARPRGVRRYDKRLFRPSPRPKGPAKKTPAQPGAPETVVQIRRG